MIIMIHDDNKAESIYHLLALPTGTCVLNYVQYLLRNSSEGVLESPPMTRLERHAQASFPQSPLTHVACTSLLLSHTGRWDAVASGKP